MFLAKASHPPLKENSKKRETLLFSRSHYFISPPYKYLLKPTKFEAVNHAPISKKNLAKIHKKAPSCPTHSQQNVVPPYLLRDSNPFIRAKKIKPASSLQSIH